MDRSSFPDYRTLLMVIFFNLDTLGNNNVQEGYFLFFLLMFRRQIDPISKLKVIVSSLIRGKTRVNMEIQYGREIRSYFGDHGLNSRT